MQKRNDLRLLPFVSISAIALFLLGFRSKPSPSPLDLVNPFVEPSNCGNCTACVGDPVEHKAALETNGIYNGEHICIGGTCAGTHPYCCVSCHAFSPPQDTAAFQAEYAVLLGIFERARLGDAGATQEMLTHYSTLVVLNADRQTLQIRGCAGSVVANLPINELQWAEAESILPAAVLGALRTVRGRVG